MKFETPCDTEIENSLGNVINAARLREISHGSGDGPRAIKINIAMKVFINLSIKILSFFTATLKEEKKVYFGC